ncbi:hypothetical protein L2D08_04955 [Domibacillus sp. PGB-M46]|uniref:hypothetical protein n=1 Tax=Domibacillus sp. PGB-M46 TaxID=2910255 RepID=UPI001F55CA79|nr:hypothetical protein [Domibacillus sp. PGB-M46]MCI2253708.1 hypothetical protein [Domibacillus sp. PGB-M46]
MGRSVWYIAVSLNGFIVRGEGSVYRFDNVKGDGGDNGCLAFYKTVGILLMGAARIRKCSS